MKNKKIVLVWTKRSKKLGFMNWKQWYEEGELLGKSETRFDGENCISYLVKFENKYLINPEDNKIEEIFPRNIFFSNPQ